VIVASHQAPYTLNRRLNQKKKFEAGILTENMKGSRNMTLKEIMAYCLVVALGLILIIHFVLFWMYGGVFIYEHNKIILALETIMSIGIIGFGIERLISTSLGKESKERTAVYFGSKAQRQANTEYLAQSNQESYKQERRQTAEPVLQR
jgi:hypothetical protein